MSDIKSREWSESLDGFSSLPTTTIQEKDSKRLHFLMWDMVQTATILLLIGASSALISFSLSWMLSISNEVRFSLLNQFDKAYHLLLFCMWSIALALCSCMFTQYVCPEAVGGGLPEMKTILSGVVKPVLLSRRLIIAKIVGLTLALSAGLSVGKEGPFIHMSAAMADQLLKLPFYKNLRRQDSKRLEILQCACASGVATTFGTPFGGVLFSIEFTSSVYMVRNLPRAFLTAITTMVVLNLLGVTDQLMVISESQINTSIRINESEMKLLPRMFEIVFFICMGVSCGLLGAGFVSVVETITATRNSLLDISKNSREIVNFRRYAIVFVAALIIAPLTYMEISTMTSMIEIDKLTAGFGENTQQHQSTVLGQRIFQAHTNSNKQPESLATYLIYLLYKLTVTALSVTLPLPVGLFTPVFMTGGIFGQVWYKMAASLVSGVQLAPWEFALIGAAAYTTGVTRGISTAVIVYELSGQPHLRLPLCIAILAAYFTGNRFTKNVYDVLIDTNDTPCMQDIMPREMYCVPVSSLMTVVGREQVLSLSSTYADGAALLDLYAQATASKIKGSSARHSQLYAPHLGTVIPVVQSQQNMVIVGSILRSDLKEVLRTIESSQNDTASIFGASLFKSTGEQARLLGTEMKSIQSAIPVTITPDTEDSLSSRWVDEEGNLGLDRYGDHRIEEPSADNDNDHDKEQEESSRLLLSTGKASAESCSIFQSEGAPQREYSSFAPRSSGTGTLSAGFRQLRDVIQYVVISEGGRRVIPFASSTTDLQLQQQQQLFNSDVTPLLLSSTPLEPQRAGTRAWDTLPYAIPLDPSPYQIVDTMYLSKVDVVFRLLKLNQAYVTRSGRLVGILTRSSMRRVLSGHEVKPIDKCRELWEALLTVFNNR